MLDCFQIWKCWFFETWNLWEYPAWLFWTRGIWHFLFLFTLSGTQGRLLGYRLGESIDSLRFACDETFLLYWFCYFWTIVLQIQATFHWSRMFFCNILTWYTNFSKQVFVWRNRRIKTLFHFSIKLFTFVFFVRMLDRLI